MQELRRLITIIQSLILFLLLPFRVVVWRRRTGAVVIRDEKQERKVWTPPQIVGRKRNIGGESGAIGCSVAPPSVPAAVVDEEVAVRRELAMRRVLEDDGSDGSSIRDFSLFTTKRGDTLFTQSWSPVSPNHRFFKDSSVEERDHAEMLTKLAQEKSKATDLDQTRMIQS